METLDSKNSVGVIVGRFQVDELHLGHCHLIEQVGYLHKKIIVVLGVSPCTPSQNDPLSYRIREQMILAHFEHIKWSIGEKILTIIPLEDCRCDQAWSRKLDKAIVPYIENETVYLYGSRDSFITCYSGQHKTIEIEEFNPDWWGGRKSGTEIREEWKSKILSGAAFKRGIIHATQNRFPTVYSTVDVAVLNRGKVLLARKEDSTEWQFIGGFLDTEDKNLRIAAARELYEETTIKIHPDRLRYIDSIQIDDWRYRKGPDKIMTHFFLLSISSDLIQPEAADDIVEAKWIELDKIKDILIPEHLPLLELLENKLVELWS